MSESAEPKDQKPAKKKGLIRLEAIVPVLVLSLLTYLYFSFYFDRHMKSLIEYVGTQANGAEVNVDGVSTSFIRGSFDLERLQVTDPERPTHNALEIGNVHFSYLWDALLRMKFVVQEASINNVMLASPRATPGHVLPPKPATPSKLEAIQDQVFAQVKNRYGGNVLGDVLALLEGGDYQDQLAKIRETLKSEARVKSMIADVNGKKEFWDGKVKQLSDTSKLKEIEQTVAAVRGEKNLVQQAQGVQKLTGLLGDVHKHYKEIEKSSKQLQAEVTAITKYPQELQGLVNEDIAALKNRFAIPQLDFKDMAMHLFAGQFAEYIAKARKYQAVAEQYLPEKKKEENEVIPPKRSEGKYYQFPITTGYPLFWLKKAAISSKGTKDSYSGQVSGELTNVTTSPSQIGKPVVLDLQGDFPASKINGVRAVLTADFTRAVGKQSALIQVNSFAVPEKLFVNDEKLKFGFLSANGSTTLTANLQEQELQMSWTSALTKPQFLVETSNKLAKEMLTNIVNNIPVITINGNARGSFSNLAMDISSNLGTELGQGFTREIGAKVAEAQGKINALVDEKINKPKQELLAAIGGNTNNLKDLGNLQKLYQQNEQKIKAEIAKLKSGGGIDGLKEKGKKIFKGIKF
jgi:uncharacterized protein (TIGR03545 family)